MKYRWSTLFVLPLFLAAVSGLFGCGGSSNGGDDSQPRSLRVLVTDAPFSFSNVKSATVEIQRIDVHRADQPEDSFQTLIAFPGGRVVDLVHLQNGVMETLFEGNPAPGDYDAVRVIVLPKQIVIDDNGTERSFPFKVPSGPQTGIKVFVSPVISVVTALSQDLVLDFDLSRSFVVQGNPNTPAGIKGFHFKPVVRAVNVSTAGTLQLTVNGEAGPLTGAVATVSTLSGDEVVSGASVNGLIRIPAIPAGDYNVTVTAAGYDPYTAPIHIVAANILNLGTITLERTLGAITGTVTTTLTPVGGGTPLVFAVPGATVSAGGLTGVTDSAGAYQLSPLAVSPPLYSVTVDEDGYDLLSGTGTAWAGATPVASDFVLVPKSGTVSGTVTRNALPVNGAAVTASVTYGPDTVVIGQTVTAADGTYSLLLPTGAYDVEATSGTAHASAPLNFVGGSPTAVTVNLSLP